METVEDDADLGALSVDKQMNGLLKRMKSAMTKMKTWVKDLAKAETSPKFLATVKKKGDELIREMDVLRKDLQEGVDRIQFAMIIPKAQPEMT